MFEGIIFPFSEIFDSDSNYEEINEYSKNLHSKSVFLYC